METWKPVVNFELFYEISDFGRVRRIAASTGTRIGKILKAYVMPHGYLQVALSIAQRQTKHYVHRLVLEAFTTKRGETVNHKNGLRSDNRLSNLEWMTYSQNIEHGHQVLGHNTGEGHWQAKLTNNAVREIRAMAARGHTHDIIAVRFGVSRPSITRIVRRDTWKHVH